MALSRKLPPLPSLRAFEAAARLGSFSQAGDELCVTHGAISHQIRTLEAFLGTTLFLREGRGVSLTQDGAYYAEQVRIALDQIARATAIIAPQEAGRRLTVSALPSFTARWLMPRIQAFMDLHPGIEVNLLTSMALADFGRDQVDLALRFGVGPWPDTQAERLLGDAYFPVCSPHFNGGELPRRPEDLANVRLLRSAAEPWRPWLRLAGLDWREPVGSLEFNDAAIMLDAAIAQRGVALARRTLVQADLDSGMLVRLFEPMLPAEAANWLVQPAGVPLSPQAEAFCHWIRAEARAFEQGRASATRD